MRNAVRKQRHYNGRWFPTRICWETGLPTFTEGMWFIIQWSNRDIIKQDVRWKKHGLQAKDKNLHEVGTELQLDLDCLPDRFLPIGRQETLWRQTCNYSGQMGRYSSSNLTQRGDSISFHPAGQLGFWHVQVAPQKQTISILRLVLH